MKTKKQIKDYFNSIPIPLAEKILPEESLIDRHPKAATWRVTRLVAVIVCVGAVTVSLIIGLNRPPEIVPIIDASKDVSKDVSKDKYSSLNGENSNINESLPEQYDASNDYTSNTLDVSSDSDNSVTTESSVPPEISDESEAPQQSDTSEPDYSDASSTVPNYPSGALTIYTDPEAGEFAGDMYRPEGYHQNIGSALALMMHYTPEADARFNVLIYTWADVEMEETISNVNETILDDIPLEQLSPINVEGDIFENLKRYHLYLTKEQINALAENHVKCMYIGSGIGEYKDMNWETAEGIKTYCEIRGDMYTFNKCGVLANPDITIEE